MHLVDSSIIVAILTGEKSGSWFRAKLDELRANGGVFINQVVYAETCALADSDEQANKWLSALVQRADLPWSASFSAGKAYRLYKSRGGKKERMLPDFLIAAHASVVGWTLITNNRRDVENYFPGLKIIAPS